MICESTEDTNRKLQVLKKEMQVVNAQHGEALEFIKQFWTEIWKIRNFVESIGSRIVYCCIWQGGL